MTGGFHPPSGQSILTDIHSNSVTPNGIADVPIMSSPDTNNSALEDLEDVVNCVIDKEFSAQFSC